MCKLLYKKINLMCCFVVLCSGCAFTEKGFHMFAVAASYFKSPVVVTTDKINEGIDVDDCKTLKKVSFDVRRGKSRDKAIKSLVAKERIDSFDDLIEKDTMIFVCLSGGGSRASALAMHSLSVLEKSYNRMRLQKESQNLSQNMHELIDGYSTVSGGSIYASALALHYMKNSSFVREEQINDDFFNVLQNKKDTFALYLKQNLSEQFQQLLQKNDKPELTKALFVKELNVILKKPLYSKNFTDLNLSKETKRFLQSQDNVMLCNRLILQDAFPEHIEPVEFDTNKSHATFFQNLVQSLQEYAILTPHGPLRSLGSTSALAYFLTAGGLPFLSTIFSDFTYLDILAAALNVHHGNYFYTTRHNLGKLPPHPRFFFNSTCIETGMPFVFTQSMMHLPEEKDFFQDKPLKHSLTLENIYSSPRKFPLNYAAIASAAFPVFTPMSIRKYQYEESRSMNDKTSDTLTLGDGGLYDNSGMTTVIDLVEYVMKRAKDKKRIILIYVDAGIEDYHYSIAKRTSNRGSSFPLKLQSPIFNPVIEGMARGTDVMHFINKQRAIKLAMENLQNLQKEQFLFEFEDAQTIEQLNKSTVSHFLRSTFLKNNITLSYKIKITKKQQIWYIEDAQNDKKYAVKQQHDRFTVSRVGKIEEVLYFPISTFQLAGFSENAIPGNDDLFRKIQSISTDFVISAEQENLLADTSEVLITSDRKAAGNSWAVGPRQHMFTCNDHIDVDNIEQLREVFTRFGCFLSQKHISVTPINANKWLINDPGREKSYLAFKNSDSWEFYTSMKKIYHLDIAFSYALLRAQLQHWHDFLPTSE